MEAATHDLGYAMPTPAQFRTQAPSRAREVSTGRVYAVSSVPPRRHGARILVVDDDQAIRDFLTHGLQEDGFRVETAADVATASTKLKGVPPELVLLDIMLAGDDGLGLLSELRRTSEVPVILLTGKGRESDRILGLKLGADDYVVKPFSMGELSARIESVLRRTAPRAPAQSLDFGALTIDPMTREVRLAGQVVETTAKEF